MADTGITVQRREQVHWARRWSASVRSIAGWSFWFATAVNGGVIVVLWARGGNLTGLRSVTGVLTSAGRITGLLGAYLLLVQVVLLARVVWIERLSGFDRLTVWHRLNGKLCLYMIVAHVVLITLGYAMTDRLSVAQEALQFLKTYPGMITATVGTVLLILVPVTSFVVVRRRLRYEVWYLVHLTAYAGILLAWFHQVPTGNEFVTNQGATAYWTALYAVTAAILVVFRVAWPATRAARFRMRVARVIEEGAGVVSVHISGRHLDRLEATAGQFFLWRFCDRQRWFEAHPFSLSRAPDGRSLRITVKNVGDFSGRLAELKPGTPVLAEGPFGLLTEEVRRHEGVLLIAGGIGITPIRALAEQLDGDVVLIFRVLRKDDVIFLAELDELVRTRGIRLQIVSGDHREAGNERLLSPQHLRELVPDIDQRDVYLCGPPGMVTAIEANLRAAAVPRRNVHIERFAL